MNTQYEKVLLELLELKEEIKGEHQKTRAMTMVLCCFIIGLINYKF
jgi:hypothetical protein